MTERYYINNRNIHMEVNVPDITGRSLMNVARMSTTYDAEQKEFKQLHIKLQGIDKSKNGY